VTLLWTIVYVMVYVFFAVAIVLFLCVFFYHDRWIKDYHLHRLCFSVPQVQVATFELQDHHDMRYLTSAEMYLAVVYGLVTW